MIDQGAKLVAIENRLIVLETELDAALLQTNTANGRGQFIHSNQINLTRLYELDQDDNVGIQLHPVAIEDAMAASLRLLNRELLPFVNIRPRAISFLPVALACQAKCPFCFSKASVSSDQAAAKPDWEQVSAWLGRAQAHGAERAVITGAWLARYGFSANDSRRALVSRGVRHALTLIFQELARSDATLWIPGDVYPVYLELARAAGIEPRLFTTLPEPKIPETRPNGSPEYLLITNPWKPLGRYLTDKECDALTGWLAASPIPLALSDMRDFLAAKYTGPANQMRRVVATVEDVRQAWPGSPLWREPLQIED